MTRGSELTVTRKRAKSTLSPEASNSSPSVSALSVTRTRLSASPDPFRARAYRSRALRAHGSVAGQCQQTLGPALRAGSPWRVGGMAFSPVTGSMTPRSRVCRRLVCDSLAERHEAVRAEPRILTQLAGPLVTARAEAREACLGYVPQKRSPRGDWTEDPKRWIETASRETVEERGQIMEYAATRVKTTAAASSLLLLVLAVVAWSGAAPAAEPNCPFAGKRPPLEEILEGRFVAPLLIV